MPGRSGRRQGPRAGRRRPVARAPAGSRPPPE